jgi:hypothetical protein
VTNAAAVKPQAAISVLGRGALALRQWRPIAIPSQIADSTPAIRNAVPPSKYVK